MGEGSSNGHDDNDGWPEGWDSLPSGTPLPPKGPFEWWLIGMAYLAVFLVLGIVLGAIKQC